MNVLVTARLSPSVGKIAAEGFEALSLPHETVNTPV
jgi:hypothetical protein